MRDYLASFGLDQLMVREFVNGLWFAMSFCVVLVFGGKLVGNLLYALHYNDGRFRIWFNDPGTRAAIPLFFYFLAETTMRGWIWLVLLYQNNGWNNDFITDDYWIALAAGFVAVWASLCCIWVFSRSQWAWVLSAAFIAAFLVLEIWIL